MKLIRLFRAPRHVLHFVRYGPLPLLASELRKRWAIFINPDATIRFGRGVICGPGFSLHIDGAGQFIVGDGVEFRREFRAEIAGDGRIVIGADCHMTYRVLMQCSTSITLGDRVQVGHCSSIFDGRHRYSDLTKPFLEQGYEFRNIHIEDDAVVHSLSTILESIGRRAVIGANAVVAKPIPAYTVAAGVPAVPIRYFGPPGEEPASLAAASASADDSSA